MDGLRTTQDASAPFAALGAPLVQATTLAELPDPYWLQFNSALAQDLGLPPDWREDRQALPLLSGNLAWPGYTPQASVYAGHQFGAWIRQLGDGRAALIAELRDRHGQPQQLQLKGAGATVYARGSDGRATLRSSIREVLACMAFEALGVPTTRALGLVGSRSLTVARDRAEPAAVLARVAPSFVRFGHFEWLAFGGSARPPAEIDDQDGQRTPDAAAWAAWRARLQPLADHVIAQHYPHLAGTPGAYIAWLADVMERTARLLAQWQTLGFCHGVMNTDNFSILGLTLDYGPYGFMDRFRTHHVANTSDADGRYAYSAQPGIGRWNCERLLQACGPLLGAQPADAAEMAHTLLQRYNSTYNTAVMQRWRAKLGLCSERDDDAGLINQFLGLVQAARLDYTRSFRALSTLHAVSNRVAHGLRESYAPVLARFDDWIERYRARLRAENSLDDRARAARMNRANPLYVLRNHLAQAAITQAEAGDLGELHTLLRVLAHPYDPQPGMERYLCEPSAEERALEVSCSS